ncbi:hypothetical protein BGX26_011276 [Mortierella sp. AD094]|nr:hypothetical protein BGX26_011276 [Mortierella sp. AD094]
MDNPPRNKILVVGRRGVGKLSLVQSILGSRFVPTTSVSKSRPSSPLILPAIPVPTIEETIVDGHGGLSQSISTFAPPTAPFTPSSFSENSFTASPASPLSQRQRQFQLDQDQQSQFAPGIGSQATQTREKLDHSGVTIPWTIDTKYYSVQVDFWIDETEAQGKAELDRMIESGELDEMGTVVEAVVFCFSKNQPSTFHDIKPWLNFVERHEPSITLCVATSAPKTETQDMVQDLSMSNEAITDYDDWCLGNGFEFIDLDDQSSDITQDEHVGLDRIMEALAAHMWDGLKRKSSKKRDQHDRSMMMSFRDDDVDMTYDSSWRGNISRRSLPGLEAGDLSAIHDHDGMLEDDDDDDEEEEDEDDDRAFYRALQELNLHNRTASPTAPARGPMVSQSLSEHLGVNGQRGNSMGFDDDFGLSEQDIKELEGDDLEIWSSQDTSKSERMAPIDRALERQFKQYLGQPLDDSITTSSDNGAKDTSGELDSSDKEFSFELNDDEEFEFGSFIVSAGPGGEDLEHFDFKFDGEDAMTATTTTSNQESIKSMHRALFANIDDDDGMAQTIATLQGLRVCSITSLTNPKLDN